MTCDIPAFAALARRHGLWLDAGIDVQGDPAGPFGTDGTAPATYGTRHLIPGFERQYTRAAVTACSKADRASAWRSARTWPSTTSARPTPRAGRSCCWCRRGTSAWTALSTAAWRSCGAWKAASARAARSGRLSLSDDRGRMVAESSSERHDAELVGGLPLRTPRTRYGRLGDLFAWLGLGDLAVVRVFAGRRPRRPLR